MGVMEDTIGEFKHAKPAEKAVIIGASVAALGIAWYLHKKSSGSTTAAAATGTPGTPQSGLQTFPFGSQPVLDSSGNPVAVIGPPPSTPGGSGSQPLPNQPGPGTSSWKPPLIPLGKYTGPNYSNLKKGTQYSYGGTNYILGTGPQGRLYGTPVNGGSQVLLYGPPSAYTPKQGGGAFGTRVLGQHGKRIAPTKEGHSYTARVYARRRM